METCARSTISGVLHAMRSLCLQLCRSWLAVRKLANLDHHAVSRDDLIAWPIVAAVSNLYFILHLERVGPHIRSKPVSYLGDFLLHDCLELAHLSFASSAILFRGFIETSFQAAHR